MCNTLLCVMYRTHCTCLTLIDQSVALVSDHNIFMRDLCNSYLVCSQCRVKRGCARLQYYTYILYYVMYINPTLIDHTYCISE